MKCDPSTISLGQQLELDEKIHSIFVSWSEERLMTGSQAYFGAYRGAVREEDDQQPATDNQVDADCPTSRHEDPRGRALR
jgi:hypothetical protein